MRHFFPAELRDDDDNNMAELTECQRDAYLRVLTTNVVSCRPAVPPAKLQQGGTAGAAPVYYAVGRDLGFLKVTGFKIVTKSVSRL